MEQYAIVYFPKINTEKINEFRKKYDSHWQIIAPHITLVSPFSDISEAQIVEHLGTITKDHQPFQIHLHGLRKTDDNLLFLLIKEGHDEIIAIHNKLYSGILAPLEQTYVFDPHITLGKPSTEVEEMDLDIHTTFDSISLIRGDGISPAKIVKTFDIK